MSDTFAALPFSRTPLFGRVESCDQAVALVEGGCALLTITGAGGIGKTRLAVAVGRELLDSFEGRVVLVELAEVAAADDVADAIATALRVRATADDSLESALINAVGFRRTLLILDNMEHLLGAAPLVGRLVERSPVLSVLVTSRSALGLSVETIFELGPLPFDSPSAPAVQLFAARASQITQGFALNEQNAASVMELCRLLDGLPLAIELAASRTPMLDPAGLSALLRPPAATEATDATRAGGLRVLSVDDHDRPPRHRALNATVEWSIALVAPVHRALLDSLVVFEGGWTLEAAEAVCRRESDDPLEVFDGIDTLLRHHLIVREPAAEVDSATGHTPIAGDRYRMLETIRQFVTEQRADADRTDLVRERHARYYVSLAGRARSGLESADEAAWTRCLEPEDANIRTAIQYLDRTGDVHGLLGIVSALGRHWRNSGRWDLGQTWLRRAVERCQGTDPPADLLAEALAWRGRLAIESGVFGEERNGADVAIAAVDDALVLARRLDDPRLLLRCIEAALAASSTSPEAARRARQLCLDGIAVSVEIGDRWWHAMLESWRGVQLRIDGDLVGAELACTTCRALARTDRNRHMAGLGGWVLSSVLIEGRRNDEAEAVLREAISDNLSVRDRRSASFCCLSLGTIALSRNDLAAAAGHFRDGLLLAQESSDWVGGGFGLMWFVSLAARSGRHQHAARIWGGLQPDLDALCRIYPSQRRAINNAAAQSREALGADLFDRLVAVGHRLGWREATIEALDVADLVVADERTGSAAATDPAVATDRSAPPSSVASNPDRLSRREIEVLRLIAEGCTNQEVAERLFISIGTAERHIANLYRKIGARRRADAVVYAVRYGITST